MVTRAIKLKDTCSLGKKAMVSPDSILKKQRHHFVHKVSYIQSYGFSIIHVQMWQLDHKKGWVTKIFFFFFWLFEQRCFWTVLLEKTHESPLDNKEIKLVNPKINQSWILEGLMAKLQYFGHLMWRANSLEMTLILQKIEGRKRRGW